MFKGLETDGRRRHRRHPGRVAEEALRQVPHRRGEGADRGHGRLRQADGNAGRAHARSRRSATRRATRRSAPAAPRPSAPTATIPRASASARTRAATARRSRSGTSASTRTSTTSVELGTRNIKVALRRLRKWVRDGPADELDMNGTIKGTAEKGYLDIQHAARAPQQDQRADLLRHRRLDGQPHQGLRGAVLGGPLRVQEHGVLLLPQLPLRERVEGQPPPPRREAERPGTCSTSSPTTTR